ncbi:hypothetical protein, partial [Bartonella sp. CL41QHWL]|uniref:hypothetical protein n=1 Tax=Bartonella sp. CL41QHWL TaxID=3243527 RepID=UPI0035CFC33A
MDFIISERECDEAKFEYYLTDQLDIKSITLKSITFYNSWWTGDILPDVVDLVTLKTEWDETINSFNNNFDAHSSLAELCSFITEQIKDAAAHVKFQCDDAEHANHVTIELTEDKIFKLNDYYLGDNYFTIVNKWF